MPHARLPRAPRPPRSSVIEAQVERGAGQRKHTGRRPPATTSVGQRVRDPSSARLPRRRALPTRPRQRQRGRDRWWSRPPHTRRDGFRIDQAVAPLERALLLCRLEASSRRRTWTTFSTKEYLRALRVSSSVRLGGFNLEADV